MPTPRWPYPRVIAHRGGGTLAPENTLAAIRTGIAHGYRAVEFDAMLAADDVPVLMHDPTLQRTAGRPGAVSELAAGELARLDVGRWHSPRFAGEPIPTLADALTLCRDKGVWPNIEIKPAPGAEEATGRAVARVTAQFYADALSAANERPRLPLLSSFSLAALQSARATSPGLPRGFLVDEIPPDWETAMRGIDAVALHVNQRRLTAQLAKQIGAAGYGVFCYTVNEPERARELMSWGVDAFCTDRIDLIGADFAR